MANQKNITIVFYSMAGCPHCIDFQNEWDKLEKMVDEKYKGIIQTKKYERFENSDEIKKAKVVSFPTIKVYKGDKVIEYDKDRKAESILDFVKNNFLENEPAREKDKKKKNQAGSSSSEKYYLTDDNAYDEMVNNEYKQCGGAKKKHCCKCKCDKRCKCDSKCKCSTCKNKYSNTCAGGICSLGGHQSNVKYENKYLKYKSKMEKLLNKF